MLTDKQVVATNIVTLVKQLDQDIAKVYGKKTKLRDFNALHVHYGHL